MAKSINHKLRANISDDNDDIVPNHGVLTHFQLANKHLQLIIPAISKRGGGVLLENPT